MKVLMLLLQITLRVKESEVQCLKQENTSLKAELQSAQRVRARGKQLKEASRQYSVLGIMVYICNKMSSESTGRPCLVLQDKRTSTKKYKDVLTELSITRAKADREVEELRENLRLAHCALDQAR